MITRMGHGKVPTAKATGYLIEFEPTVIHYEAVGQSA